MTKLVQSTKATNEKVMLASYYEQLALNTFTRGLPNLLQLIIRVRKPDNLEDALAIIAEEENFAYYNKVCSSSQFNAPNLNLFKSKPMQKAVPTPNYYTPVLQNHFQPGNQFPNHFQLGNQNQSPPLNQFQSTSTPNKFPSQPINIQPRPIPQRFPTNKQVFGKPTNVWKPTNAMPQARPTPMSGISRFTQQPRQQVGPTRPNYPSPRYHAEELFQVEDEVQETYEDPEAYDYSEEPGNIFGNLFENENDSQDQLIESQEFDNTQNFQSVPQQHPPT